MNSIEMYKKYRTKSLRHSLGRPSRSDLVLLEYKPLSTFH